MNGLMVLLTGFVAGAVIASGVWAILWVVSKNENRIAKQRSEVMQDIAADCAEIDSRTASHAMKTTTDEAFQSTVSSRIRTISRKLTTNMHLLDVYYVKYIESLVAQYRRDLETSASGPAAAPKDKASSPMPSMKIDESFSLPAQPAVVDVTQALDIPHDDLESDKDQGLKNKSLEATPDKEVFKQMDFEVFEDKPTKVSNTAATEEMNTTASKKTEETELSIEAVADTRSSDAKTKDTKVIQSDTGHADIEKVILEELNRELIAKEKELSVEKPDMKMRQETPVLKKGDDLIAEIPAQPLKKEETPVLPEVQDEKGKAAPQRKADDNFISGEDLVAKLDSFFGIKE